MKKYFQQLLDKWFCLHDWKEFERIVIYSSSRELSKEKIIVVCNKCGKIKKIEL